MARDASPCESLTEYWTVSCIRRTKESSDTQRQVDMSWENRTPAEIMANLNAFLVAVNVPLKVIAAR